MAGEVDPVNLEGRLANIEGHLSSIDKHLGTQNGRLSKVEVRVSDLEHRNLYEDGHTEGFQQGQQSLKAMDIVRLLGVFLTGIGVLLAGMQVLG